METFALQMISAALEPIGVIGYVLCGLLLPRLWLALPAAMGWAALMQVWEVAQARARHSFSTFELLLPRLAVAMAIAALLCLAMDAWRQSRADRRARRDDAGPMEFGAAE